MRPAGEPAPRSDGSAPRPARTCGRCCPTGCPKPASPVGWRRRAWWCCGSTARSCPSAGVNGDGRRFRTRPTKVCTGRTTPVPVRVSPTDKIRGEMDALFGSGRDLAVILEDVARLGARLIMQSALEAEVQEFLGRARYQRRSEVPDARPGARNGYCPTTVKTTAGPVTLERPKLRGTDEKFVSRLFGT